MRKNSEKPPLHDNDKARNELKDRKQAKLLLKKRKLSERFDV